MCVCVSFIVDDRPKAQRLVAIYNVSLSNIGPPTRIYRKYRHEAISTYLRPKENPWTKP